MRLLSDTSYEAEQVLRKVFRRMPLDRKWRQIGAIYQTAHLLHQAGLQARASAAQKARPSTMLSEDDNLRVMQEVIAVLDQLGIACALGGSWASSLLGKMRFTHVADLAAEPFPGREAELCSRFGPDYYLSVAAVEQANRDRGAFNIIHTPSGFKVDLFVRKDRPFERSVMSRRFAFTLPDGPGQTIQCVSAEDLILLKLEWYRLGDESSQQQLQDVRGVLEIQAERLDQAYLDHWAAELGIQDLLARVREESAL